MDKEHGTGQEDEGEGELADDQHLPETVLRTVAGRAARPAFKRIVDRHAGGHPGRGDAKEKTRDQRSAEGEEQESPIEGEVEFESAGGELPGHPVVGPDGNQNAEAAASGREETALGEKRLDQLGAGGAQRAADGEFTRPGDGPREQQVRQVRTGDQQHEAGQADEQEDDLLAGALEGGGKRHGAQRVVLVFFRIAFGETGGDRGEPGRGLGGGYPLTIASDDIVGVILPAAEFLRRQGERPVDFGRVEGSWIAGRRRGHANDLVRLAVQPHGAADHAPVTAES